MLVVERSEPAEDLFELAGVAGRGEDSREGAALDPVRRVIVAVIPPVRPHRCAVEVGPPQIDPHGPKGTARSIERLLDVDAVPLGPIPLPLSVVPSFEPFQ